MLSRLETWLYRVAALSCMGLLAYLSSLPGSDVHLPSPLDKVVHLCSFGVLGFLIALGVGPRRRWHAAWIAPLIVAAFGATDELHQMFTAGRSVSLDDWLCDAAGGLAAGIAWFLAWSQGARQKTGKPS